jgi:nucleoside-diphosphate-sugar epimerase
MSKILVTGATGFLGSAVVEDLTVHGHDVIGLTRRDTGDLSGALDWTPWLGGVDVIVHCAARAHVLDDKLSDPLTAFRAVNRNATLALARDAASAGVRRLVFVSSIGVNGSETFGTPFTATDTPSPHSPYAISKYEAEQGLRRIATETGLEVVIIRPPLVLGRDPKGNLGTLLRVMRKGLPLPFGLVTGNRRDLVSLSTLTDFVRVCHGHPAAAGQTFVVSDGVTRSTREICGELARMNGITARFLPVPRPALALGFNMLGKTAMKSQLLGDLEVDIGAAKLLLGWVPPELG